MLSCCVDKQLSGEMNLMRNITDIPHEVFANDLIFFLCEESKIRWTPPCYETYSVHPSSPLTADVRAIIEIWFGKKCDGHFKSNYDSFNFTWEVYQRFCKDVTSTVQKLSSADIPEDISVQEVFFHIISVAKLSIMVYEGGHLEALTYASTRITEALKECNRKTDGKMFHIFAHYASPAVRRFTYEEALISDATNRPHEIFANDLMLYFSENRRAVCVEGCCQLSKSVNGSPLSSRMHPFLAAMYHKPDSFYQEPYIKYKDGCNTKWEVFQNMLDDMNYEFKKMSIKNIPAETWAKEQTLVNQFLNKIVHFARICVILHHRCTHASLCFGQLKLAEVLRICNEATNGRIFDLIRILASSVINMLEIKSHRGTH